MVAVGNIVINTKNTTRKQTNTKNGLYLNHKKTNKKVNVDKKRSNHNGFGSVLDKVHSECSVRQGKAGLVIASSQDISCARREKALHPHSRIGLCRRNTSLHHKYLACPCSLSRRRRQWSHHRCQNGVRCCSTSLGSVRL